jgi:hypothetical protein
MELKMMLAHIILSFDVQYPEGIRTRPKNRTFDGAIIPDTQTKLIFKARDLLKPRESDNGVVRGEQGKLVRKPCWST